MKKNNIYKPCRSGKENTREVQNPGELPWFWFGVVTPVFASILRTKSSRNVTFTRPNFRSVPFFARPFSRESHHFAQPFLYVTFSLRDQIFAVLNFAIFSLREDKVVAKKWEFTVHVDMILYFHGKQCLAVCKWLLFQPDTVF